MASLKNKLLVPPHVKEFYPTPSTTIGFANQDFKIDIVMKDTTMADVLDLLEFNARQINPFRSTTVKALPSTFQIIIMVCSLRSLSLCHM
jgi:hypothetical protein